LTTKIYWMLASTVQFSRYGQQRPLRTTAGSLLGVVRCRGRPICARRPHQRRGRDSRPKADTRNELSRGPNLQDPTACRAPAALTHVPPRRPQGSNGSTGELEDRAPTQRCSTHEQPW
jgi:hypothetical protein